MGSDLAPLVDRIRLLVHEPTSDPSERLLQRMEHTLTDGYAHALALEAESMRIEREIDAAVTQLRNGARADKLGPLSDRLAATQRDLRRLRELLTMLRRHAEAVRRSLSAAC